MAMHAAACAALATAFVTVPLAADAVDAVSPIAASTSGRAAPPLGDPRRGAALYEAKCGACHSLDANRVGPAHRGVFGRQAGTAPNYAYSNALRASGLVWTAANLDRWLAAPGDVVAGTRMGFRLGSAQDRADVIAFLRAATAATGGVTKPPARTR
jgi:cytochrome c